MAYEFGSNKGMIQYIFPAGKQPDTEEDSIALGFITTKTDAVLLRIESTTTQDYMELEIVIKFIKIYFKLFENKKILSFRCRLKETFSWYITLVHMIFRLVKLVPE